MKWAIVTVLLLGAGVRLWGVREQVPEDDEMHAVFAVRQFDAPYLFTHHNAADYSIPMALWDLAGWRLGRLDEDWLRAPVMAAGLAFLLAFAWWLWRARGPRAALVGSLLASFSPLLVRYSRYARPYMPVVLLSFVAVVAALRWRRREEPLWAIVCALAGALTVWANPIAAPVVGIAWALSLGRGRKLAAVMAGLGLLGMLLGPSLPSLLEVSRAKVGVAAPTWSQWREAVLLLFGPRDVWLIVWLVASAAWGAVALARSDRVLAVTATAAVLLPPIVVQLLKPLGADDAHVLARYVLGGLPWMLLLITEGLLAQAALLSRGRALVAVAVVPLLVWRGPLPHIFAGRDAWSSHNDLWRQVQHPAALPPLYRGIEGRIIEAPWMLEWRYSYFYLYQEQHHRPVSTVWTAPGGSQFRTLTSFGNMQLEPGDRLIIHRDIVGETNALLGREEPEGDAWLRKTNRTIADWLIDQALQRPDLTEVASDAQVVVFARSPTGAK